MHIADHRPQVGVGPRVLELQGASIAGIGTFPWTAARTLPWSSAPTRFENLASRSCTRCQKATRSAIEGGVSIEPRLATWFGIAGLCENFKDPHSGEWVRTVAIITVPANELVATIHDRMPAILHRADYDRWLRVEPDPRDALRPFPSELLKMWPISTRVNSPMNDDEDLIRAELSRRSPWASLPASGLCRCESIRSSIVISLG